MYFAVLWSLDITYIPCLAFYNGASHTWQVSKKVLNKGKKIGHCLPLKRDLGLELPVFLRCNNSSFNWLINFLIGYLFSHRSRSWVNSSKSHTASNMTQNLSSDRTWYAHSKSLLKVIQRGWGGQAERKQEGKSTNGTWRMSWPCCKDKVISWSLFKLCPPSVLWLFLQG